MKLIPVLPTSPVRAVLPSYAVKRSLSGLLRGHGPGPLFSLRLADRSVGVHVELHQGYADRFNAALEGVAVPAAMLHDWSGCQLHNLFWEGLGGGIAMPGYVAQDFVAAAALLRGSGWVCLSNMLAAPRFSPMVHLVQNHEYPWESAEPLLVLDLWEHAFTPLLTERSGYFRGLLELVDWSVVERRLRG